MLTPESLFGLPQRPPSNRHNAYHSPGELANLATPGGLQSSDCRNTTNAPLTSVVTSVLGGNTTPSVQPGFSYNGLTQYYPHVTRAPK